MKNKLSPHERIKYRIRKKVNGTSEKPRLVVYRSLNNIYVQIIDDINGKTLCSASSIEKDVKSLGKKSKSELSKEIGKSIAAKALGLKIKKVVFDRNGYLYHGRIKSVADGAREAGLEF